jgi:hypothetical protein
MLYWAGLSSTTVSTTNWTNLTSVTVNTINTSGYCSHSTIEVIADANYFIAGTGSDSFYSRVLIDGNESKLNYQFFTNAGGGGTRSSVLMPLYGLRTKKTDVNTSVTVVIQARRLSSDDNITFYAGNNAIISIKHIPFPRTSG